MNKGNWYLTYIEHHESDDVWDPQERRVRFMLEATNYSDAVIEARTTYTMLSVNTHTEVTDEFDERAIYVYPNTPKLIFEENLE